MRLLTVMVTLTAVCALFPPAVVGEISQEADLDALVRAGVQARGMAPAPLCSDEVFFRRVYLDVIGVLPKVREVTQFLRDSRPDKRARCIERLLAREEFADYWALKWGDLLRVKAEFPINLWPNAVQAYHRWIRDAVKNNMPYDEFARTLLTSSGSNFRVGPVNFYRALQGREPAAIAAAVALTFMGTRIESWPEAQRAGLEAFFPASPTRKRTSGKRRLSAGSRPTAPSPCRRPFRTARP